jgi:hypothetical protein
VSIIDLRLPECERSYIEVPASIEFRTVSFGDTKYPSIRISGRLRQPRISIDTSVFVVIADFGDPICSFIWCLHPCSKGQSYKFLEVWDNLLQGQCTHYGFLEYTSTYDFRRYRNSVNMIASPNNRWPAGLNFHRALPNGTVMWLGDADEWAGDNDVLIIYYATVKDESTESLPLSLSDQIAMDGPWPESYFWHRTVHRHGGHLLANLTKGLAVDVANIMQLTTMDIPSKQPEASLILDVSGTFPHSAAFATIIGTSLAILTQPYGSLFHRRLNPRFWRLVPGYAMLECGFIVILALIVLPRAHSIRGFCTSCMIFRDPNYRRHRGKSTSDIIKAITEQAGFQTGRLISTAAIAPAVLILLKVSVVEGATLVTAFCLCLTIPYLFLQLIILAQPDNLWTSRNINRIAASLDKIRGLAQWFGFETPAEDTQHNDAHASMAKTDVFVDTAIECAMMCTINLAFSLAVIAHGTMVPNIFWHFNLPYPWNLFSTFYHLALVTPISYLILYLAGSRGFTHFRRWRWYPGLLFFIMDVMHVATWANCVAICLSEYNELGTSMPSWLSWIG